jgi:hypothetical protein
LLRIVHAADAPRKAVVSSRSQPVQLLRHIAVGSVFAPKSSPVGRRQVGSHASFGKNIRVANAEYHSAKPQQAWAAGGTLCCQRRRACRKSATGRLPRHDRCASPVDVNGITVRTPRCRWL